MRRPSGPIGDFAAASALVLAAACALASVLAQGGRFNPYLDLPSHFAPFYVLAAVVAALVAICIPRRTRGRTLILSAIALAGGAALMAPEFLRSTGTQAAPGAPGQIKVIQFNVARTNRDLPRVVDWLVAQHPDVVTINEASPAVRDAIVNRTGWHVSGGMGDLMIFTPEKRLRMDRLGGYEMVLNWVNATYPGASGPYEVMTAHLRWPNWPEIAVQEKTLGILIHHLPTDRMILAGDFNSTPWSFTRQRDDKAFGLIRRDRALASWPTWSPVPFLAIDHIYAGPGWATVKVERGPKLGSDHYPVVVTLAPRASSPASPRPASVPQPGASSPPRPSAPVRPAP